MALSPNAMTLDAIPRSPLNSSAFAGKVTRRAMRDGMISVSGAATWLLASTTPPVAGTFSTPSIRAL